MLKSEVFPGKMVRYSLDPDALRRSREKEGLSTGYVADLCGWSRQYQEYLEAGGQRTISGEAAELLSLVLGLE